MSIESNILEQLEISGVLAAFLLIAYCLYKLIIIRGLHSRCGLFSIDFRSKSTRQKELEYDHDIKLKQIELDLERIKLSRDVKTDQDVKPFEQFTG